MEWEAGQPCHTVLELRTAQPLTSSEELAAELGRRVGRAYTAAAARQLLHRAREKFADLLLDAVAGSLDNPTADRLADELAVLGLGGVCQAALRRRFGAG